MLTLYTADTPNGQKITIALEELGLPHKVHHVNLSAGEQHQPPFSVMSPNHKIPLLVDDTMPIFESGAILIHLADKAGKLLPASGAERSVALQWLFLQVGHIGPMLGQLWFFRHGIAKGSPRNELTVTVSDEGPGIRGDITRIFQRFYTDRPDGEHFGDHSGLGLAISKQIVEAHNGTIRPENRTDRSGAIFTVTLPRIHAEPKPRR